MEYYINHRGISKGPFTVEELERFKVSANTLVSLPDGSGWIEASKVNELKEAIEDSTTNTDFHATPYIPTTAPISHEAQYATQPRFNKHTEPCPKNWLVESVLMTSICCLPFGILALIKSLRVEELHTQRDYKGAKEASKQAGNYFYVGLFSGLFFWFIYVALITVAVAVENR